MYYCDGSTYKNGQEGQDSSIIVVCPGGYEIREHIGDYSINYAELAAIIKAFEICDLGSEVATDSQICANWINYPYKETKRNKYLKEKILYAKDLLHEKGLMLKKVPRDYNLAGISVEESPFYGVKV